MSDSANASKEARELCDLPGSHGTLAVVRRDAIQILRGYWRDVEASFGETEIKNMVELLEAFVARRKPDPTPELRERIARVLYAQDSDAGPVFYAQEYAETVDAVLSALKGEPK